MGQKKNLHTLCPTSSCCFTKGQNKQDKICPIHSSKETGVRNVTHPSPSNSTMWPGAAQPRTETPEAGTPACARVPGSPSLHSMLVSRESQTWFHFWTVGLVAFIFSDRRSGVRQGGLGAHNSPTLLPAHWLLRGAAVALSLGARSAPWHITPSNLILRRQWCAGRPSPPPQPQEARLQPGVSLGP